MIELKAINLHWISEEETEKDICAHGQVWLKIESKIVSDENAGDWTVSTTAYNLLNTLQDDYEGGGSSQLIPHCGHFMILDKKTEDVIIFGCSNGIDWKINHHGNKVIHIFADGETIETDKDEWAGAVRAFSDQIMDFYQESKRKEPYKEEREAYEKFIMEWKRMREQTLP